MAKDGLRMVVTMYLYIPLSLDTIENINADRPGSVVVAVSSQSSKLWKTRMALIAGYGLYKDMLKYRRGSGHQGDHV